MRRLALILAFISACWVAPVTYVEPRLHHHCTRTWRPDRRCDTHYVWQNRGYRYDGVWHGGRYYPRPNVVVRDHRR